MDEDTEAKLFFEELFNNMSFEDLFERVLLEEELYGGVFQTIKFPSR